MTKETKPRGHYDAFIEGTQEVEGLAGLVQGLNQRDVRARHATLHKLELPDDLSNTYDELSDQIQGKRNLARDVSESYFINNLDNIVDEIPQEKLGKLEFSVGLKQKEDRLIFYSESVKNGNKEHDEFVNREANYHTLNEMVRVYGSEKTSGLESERLTEIVGNYLAQQEKEGLEKMGYDVNGRLAQPISTILALTKKRAQLIRKSDVYKIANGIVGEMEKELRESVPKDYVANKLKALGKNEPDRAKRIVYSTKVL